MSAQGTIKRYTLIIEKIASARFPSFPELKNYLSDQGFDISIRTLQRNIDQIRYEFGIEIIYDRKENGYFINKEASINIDAFMKFLEIAGTADLLKESLKVSKDALNYISFETEGNLKGVEHLKSLLLAIQNHRRILFTHQNFEKGKLTKYRIQPYLLKEYQNRWYIIGLPHGANEFRTFGIDRIESIEVLTETFKPDPKLNPAKLFDNIIGLNYSTDKPEEVILFFTSLQGKYIKALPLHRSQQIIKETNNETLVKITVIPNFELKQKLLMMGENVKVVKPAWFVKEMKMALANTLKQYKK